MNTLIQSLTDDNQRLTSENEKLRIENMVLQEKYDLLTYKRFVRSSEQEKSNNAQQSLFAEEEEKTGAETETEIPEEKETITYTRKKNAGRKPIPAEIPREVEYIDLSEDEKRCACGAELEKIGVDVCEKLEIVPMRIFVKRTEKAKYACPCCKGHREDPDAPSVIRTASAPPAIIPGSIASASLLAHVFSNKFENHLPYFRLEKQFAQIGVNVSRQDMVNWQVKIFEILLPLLALLLDTLKSGPVIRMDETTVQVMGEEDRKDTQKSYMWLARGGPPDKPVVIFKYHPSRASEHVNEFIEGFTGFLQTDGYGGYDCALKTHPAVVHVGCFAHARRKFFEAEKCGSQSRPASVALGYIRQLYAIEKELRDKALPDGDFLNQRKERALPVLTAFKKWLDKKYTADTPASLLGKAVFYTLNQWEKLTAYLESPYLTPDNNLSENAIRPFVIGRKNWLFYKSPAGAKSACALYSLIETAKQNSLVPSRYLTHLFEYAPRASSLADWDALLPWNVTC